MIRATLLLGALAALSACGVDGAPQRPGTELGVTLSGTISAGIGS